MKRLGAVAASLTLALGVAACGGEDEPVGGGAEGGGKIRVALGDIESVETLALFIAMERVRKRGIEVEVNELADEDLANQAVVGGQSDVGLGAPYGLIEGSGAPLRIFCQLQSVKFFPVADKAAYPDWQSLDGGKFAVHSRGSTSEALAHIIEAGSSRSIRAARPARRSPTSSSRRRASSSARSTSCPAPRCERRRCCAATSRPPCSTSRTRTT